MVGEFTPINKPELCKQYLERLKSLPNSIKSLTLNKIVENLLLSPYILALQEMENVLSTSNITLNRTKSDRIKSLLRKGADLKKNKTLNFRESEMPYQVRITKPGTSIDNLMIDLIKVNTCHVQKEIMNLETAKQIVNWIKKDIDIGACIILFGEEYTYKERNPKMMNRCYVGINKKEENVLFLDTIEGGEILWNNVVDWTRNKRGKELLYALAAANYIAIEYGIKKVVIGEREAEELSSMLGYSEEEVFDEYSKPCYRGAKYYSGDRKIGLPGQPCNATIGPYAYMLYRDSRRRTIDLSKISNYNVDELENILDDISKKLTVKMKRNKNKMNELSLYVSIIHAINKLPEFNSETIKNKINSLATKGIELYIGKSEEERLEEWMKIKNNKINTLFNGEIINYNK